MGLAFLLVPALPISLDRITADLALVALAAGSFYFHETGQFKRMLLAMALMCLTRETRCRGLRGSYALEAGFVSGGGSGSFCGLVPVCDGAAPASSAPVDFHRSVPGDLGIRFPPHVFSVSQADRFRGPVTGSCGPGRPRRRDRRGSAGCRSPDANPVRLSGVVFGGLAVYLMSLDGWTHVYDFGRILSPLALTLLIRAAISAWWWLLAPACLMTLRVVAQMAPQALGVVRPGWRPLWP